MSLKFEVITNYIGSYYYTNFNFFFFREAGNDKDSSSRMCMLSLSFQIPHNFSHFISIQSKFPLIFKALPLVSLSTLLKKMRLFLLFSTVLPLLLVPLEQVSFLFLSYLLVTRGQEKTFTFLSQIRENDCHSPNPSSSPP